MEKEKHTALTSQKHHMCAH